MHGPPELPTGRGMLLFAAITFALALWMSVGNGDWAGAGLWYALSVFLGCYGAMMGGAPERWHRALLVVGLVAGVVAFVFALRLAGIWS
ncbi:MAG: hypothetical protein AVDCRST_MAG26-4376 [uncultured Chloroflexia bacterium]|uniref:Uncharacterized protein n=1 Tax=uncultured Chloroflexia bacterium TaxID=1672391 RepID=A0A6J4K3S4_9CHLR|nr:MAG: hypothetical protein AVDCRST_MAG26-4376 [uncultured Chloroflexia bacterium]